MNMKYILLLSVFLAGCADTIKVDSEPLQLPPVTAPKPAPLSLNPITWSAKKAGSVVTYCLNTDNFSNLLKNNNEIARYIQEQKEVINFWQSYINGKSTIANTTKSN